MASSSKRLIGIDALRALAVIGVIAEHLRESALTGSPRSGLDGLAWVHAAGSGTGGVILFFAISGFVITRTVLQRDGELQCMRVGAFYRRRLARLGPAFALYLAVSIAALLLVSPKSKTAQFVLFGDAPITPAFWLSVVTSTFNFEAIRSALAGHKLGWNWIILWSLSVEEQFYLFFPLLARLARVRVNFWIAIAALVLLSVVSRIITQIWLPVLWPFATPDFVDALAVGVAAAALPRCRLSREWALRGATLGLCILPVAFLVQIPVLWAAKPLFLAIGTALIMYCCDNGAVFTGCIWLPFARIGRVSYGIYLFHPLVLLALAPVLSRLSFLPALAVLIAAATLVAELSFAFVERPAGQWLSRARTAPPAVIPGRA